jgi:hypothetical protein
MQAMGVSYSATVDGEIVKYPGTKLSNKTSRFTAESQHTVQREIRPDSSLHLIGLPVCPQSGQLLITTTIFMQDNLVTAASDIDLETENDICNDKPVSRSHIGHLIK